MSEQTGPKTAAPSAPEPAAASEALAPHPPMTDQEIDDLKARAAKAEENWDRLLRTTADFENFKKRAARERQDAARLANEGILLKLLPVLENLEMAISAAKAAPEGAAKQLQTGVEMIGQQLRAVLTEAGVEEVDAAGKLFDPTLHEAISQLPSAEVAEGQVLHQIRKGYRWQGRLLRPASVVVARAPDAAADKKAKGK